ncbi:MAG: signal peptidase I [Bacillota bacterium]|nr:signal peptidase I [Bacillota bacterium]
MQKDKKRSGSGWRSRNAPYIIAFTLAVVMFMLVAPEVNEGDSMDPSISGGQLLVVSKSSYAPNRDIPERDSIVILEKTESQKISDDNIIARVAGLPDETVEIKGGKVLIDGREYVTENGIKGASGDMKIKLGKREVFLLCDNREELLDSRNSKLGAVDMKEIKGNVLFRIWPFSEFGGIK